MKWEETDNRRELLLRNNFTPLCEFCGVEMKRIIVNPGRFDLHGITREEENRNSRKLDVEFYCTNDGLRETFGVAVGKEHYDKFLDLVGLTGKEGRW